jgi:hypothetical protein
MYRDTSINRSNEEPCEERREVHRPVPGDLIVVERSGWYALGDGELLRVCECDGCPSRPSARWEPALLGRQVPVRLMTRNFSFHEGQVSDDRVDTR